MLQNETVMWGHHYQRRGRTRDQRRTPDTATGSMQNYSYISWLPGINIYSFSIHMLYHWKDIRVQFPTQQKVHLLNFRARSYDHFSGKLHRLFCGCGRNRGLFNLSTNIIFHLLFLCLCSHPTRRDVSSMNKPCNPSVEGVDIDMIRELSMSLLWETRRVISGASLSYWSVISEWF